MVARIIHGEVPGCFFMQLPQQAAVFINSYELNIKYGNFNVKARR
jgi:hypothetical protein